MNLYKVIGDVYKVVAKAHDDEPFIIEKAYLIKLPQNIVYMIEKYGMCEIYDNYDGLSHIYIDLDFDNWAISNDSYDKIIKGVRQLIRTETIDTILL